MLFGLLAASVVKVKLAVLAVEVVGENTTFREQEASAARVAPQVFVLIENCPASVPVSAMLEIFSVAFPELVKVTAVFPLEVPVF